MPEKSATTHTVLHVRFIWGGTLLVESVLLRLMLSGTTTWRAIARFLVDRVG